MKTESSMANESINLEIEENGWEKWAWNQWKPIGNLKEMKERNREADIS
jgi:hypothetical protein